MKPKLYVFDISNLIHRAAHAMGDLKASNGFPTGAIYGTFTMLSGFAIKKHPENILICYDHAGPESLRKDFYPEYKANRIKQDNISAQELIIRKMIELLGMTSVVLPGYEADDLVAAAVEQYHEQYDIEIVTGDKDLLQLIRPGVQVFDSMRNVYYGDEEVKKKFGVRPDQIVDFLAIAGDKVDNIPGVKGLGKVGVGKLLAEYNNLEEIYENIDSIKGKTQEKLIKCRDDAFVSKRLASLFTDVAMPDPADLGFNPARNADLVNLFTKLEFNNGLIKLNNLWAMYK